jgi:hypothetical protein
MSNIFLLPYAMTFFHFMLDVFTDVKFMTITNPYAPRYATVGDFQQPTSNAVQIS